MKMGKEDKLVTALKSKYMATLFILTMGCEKAKKLYELDQA